MTGTVRAAAVRWVGVTYCDEIGCVAECVLWGWSRVAVLARYVL